MPSDPQVFVIVLNWNQPRDTIACLRSLQLLEYPSYEVTVVDNGSTDGSDALIEAGFPQVAVIRNETNVGFAAGNNVGITDALERGADYVLLLNNDTVVAPDLLTALITEGQRDVGTGILGPTIYHYHQPHNVWKVGGTIDGLGRTWDLAANLGRNIESESPRPVDFVTGCAMMVKRTVMDRVGLIDPRFFIYYEELDWCIRAKRAGFAVVYVPRAKVWHKIAAGTRSESPRVAYLMTRNRLLFLTKLGYPSPVILSHLAQMLLKELREQGRVRRAVLRGAYDHLRGQFGAPSIT